MTEPDPSNDRLNEALVYANNRLQEMRMGIPPLKLLPKPPGPSAEPAGSGQSAALENLLDAMSVDRTGYQAKLHWRTRKFIYFAQCHEYIKIGIATDVQHRLSGLQTGNPYPITIIATLHTTNSTQDESAIHKIFEKYHFTGEWFLIPPDAPELVLLLSRGAYGKIGPSLRRTPT